MPEITAYLALGSNLGNRLQHLRDAARSLAASPQIQVTAYSRIYETDPVGGPAGQGTFLNAVLQVSTLLTAQNLLTVMFAIEQAHARQRDLHWGPRTLDLDLLLFGTERINEPSLIVPHPRLAIRNFVLLPLCDLAPDLIIPGTSQTVRTLKQSAGEAGLQVTPLTF